MESGKRINHAIRHEIRLADELAAMGHYNAAFHHLERAHVLGQSSTYEHTRVHWRMLKLAFKLGSPREIWGQFIRIIGASTKTPFGIYPTGNTGGANIWFFEQKPIPDDLQKLLTEKER